MIEKQTRDMFATEFMQIKRIEFADILERNKNFDNFVWLINKHNQLYPNIKQWLFEKVMPGIERRERIAYICLFNDQPVATAILKKGEKAKFCHLFIEEQHREKNIGDLFFSLMTIHARREARKVYFTLPRVLWETKKGFFNSFGFVRAQLSNRQYRKNMEELVCQAAFIDVFRSSLAKTEKIIKSLTGTQDNIYKGVLISIRPEYAEAIACGRKIVEIRKRFSKKWIGSKAVVYSTKPTQTILGHATIVGVEKQSPVHIWDKYQGEIGSSKLEFNKYVGSADEVFAIKLNNFEPYRNPISLSQATYLLGQELTPPQSHLAISNNNAWLKAIALSELLHGRFKIYSSTFCTDKQTREEQETTNDEESCTITVPGQKSLFNNINLKTPNTKKYIYYSDYIGNFK